MMGDAGSELTEGARDYWEQGRDLIRDFDDRVEDSVREHPLTAIFAAVGFGVVLGILLTAACPASFPQIKGRR
jgi:ElaB/YqjD/DUF883 family membrane-anchored ribosome-binding protein